LIVGAGIVGLYLAARMGDAEVWEKNKVPRPKSCSGLVSLTGLRATGLPWKECALNYARGAVFHTQDNEITVERSNSQAVVLDRDKLHRIMIEEAEAKGAKIRWNSPWNGQPDPRMPILGADGAASEVARRVNGNHKKHVFTYQIEAELSEDIDPEFVHLYFGDFAPGFFAWTIPLSEKKARIGIGVNQGNPRAAFNNFAKNMSIKEWENAQAGVIPLFTKSRIVYDNMAIVGDAAGQIKNTTGGGIVFGCKSARLLAEAVDKGNIQWYEKKFKEMYEHDLVAHARIRTFIDKVGAEKAFDIANKMGFKRVAEEEGDMDHVGNIFKKFFRTKAMMMASFL